MGLGERIASLRRANNITQVQLAEALGVSQQTLQSYEVGRRRQARAGASVAAADRGGGAVAEVAAAVSCAHDQDGAGRGERAVTALQPVIQSRILALREQRVMLDADLAQLYGVETRVLVQAVKRNLARFPEDFMFQLSAEEWAALRSQSVISNTERRGGRRTAPYAFTEQGVAMLSTVLGSTRAIAVNIEIMRTFVRVLALAATHDDLAKRLAELEEKTEALAMNHDTFSHNTRAQLKKVFDALRELMTPPDPPKRPIGFINPEDKGGKKASGAKGKT